MSADIHVYRSVVAYRPVVVSVFGKDPARASRECCRFFMFTPFSKHPHCFLARRCIFCAFAVFRDALAVIVACWHARVCSGGWWGGGGWGGVGWGGVGGGVLGGG